MWEHLSGLVRDAAWLKAYAAGSLLAVKDALQVGGGSHACGGALIHIVVCLSVILYLPFLHRVRYTSRRRCKSTSTTRCRAGFGVLHLYGCAQMHV